MKLVRLSLLALSIVVALLACKKPEDTAPAATPPVTSGGTATPTTPVAKPGSDLATMKTLEPSQDVRGLIGEMQREAQNRPKVEITAERVFEALEKAGINALRRKQYVASIAKANYCAGGTTSDGIAISICEYTDAKSATAGRAYLDTELAKLAPNARRATKASTVLSIVAPDPVKQKDTVERATSAFVNL